MGSPITLNWSEGEVLSTKEVAAALKITTKAAYKLLCAGEAAGLCSKYGYRAGHGVWESPEHSGRQSASLHWQKN